jgi:hypothetical protein
LGGGRVHEANGAAPPASIPSGVDAVKSNTPPKIDDLDAHAPARVCDQPLAARSAQFFDIQGIVRAMPHQQYSHGYTGRDGLGTRVSDNGNQFIRERPLRSRHGLRANFPGNNQPRPFGDAPGQPKIARANVENHI